jgi:hypothetical protein
MADTSGIFRDIFQDWKPPEKDIVGKLSDAYSLWQDWAAGKDLPEQDQKAIEAFNKYSGIGPGIIAGGRSILAPTKKIAEAAALDKLGYPANELWRRTKVQKFPWDDKFKWEIPDEGVTLTPRGEDAIFDPKGKDNYMGLFEAVNAPRWRAAYPNMSDVAFRTLPANQMRGARGSYNQATKTITMRQVEELSNPDSGFTDLYDPMRTIPHEVQHWVQRFEGFPSGYNPNNTSVLRKEFPSIEEARLYADFVNRYQLPGLKFDARVTRNSLGDSPAIVTIIPNKTAADIYPVAAGELEANAAAARYQRPELLEESPLDTIKRILAFDNKKLSDVIANPHWQGLFE